MWDGNPHKPNRYWNSKEKNSYIPCRDCDIVKSSEGCKNEIKGAERNCSYDSRPLWKRDPPEKGPYEEIFKTPLERYEVVHIPPCIYFLLKEGEVVYIGQSVHLPGRCQSHSKGDGGGPPKIFDEVRYVPMPNSTEQWRKDIERQLVYLFRPRYNGANSKKGTSCYESVPWEELEVLDEEAI